MNKKTEYHLWHYWEGDKYAEPGWVGTGVFRSPAAVRDEINSMKKMGWNKFRCTKVETTDFDLDELMKPIAS